MSNSRDPKTFAMLVHQGLLSPDIARAAMSANDPVQHLIDEGHVTQAQWDDWVVTEGGTRPVLKRYELGKLLGEGGMARVFEATDRGMGDISALKVLKPAVCKDPTAVARFIEESKLLMELDCEHIVAGHRVAREGESIYCEMELLEGRCLQDGLSQDAPMREADALRVVVQIADALEHLHERGFVHRDIKPGNIVLCDDGRAVLIDLGFAVAGAGGEGESETTSGTAHYISPEQAKGAVDLDVRADIYSLGCTLYHLITGSLPFEGDSSEEVMARQVLDDLSGERIKALGLSQQVHFFIEKMMAKEKEIRFQSPQEMVLEIQAYLDTLDREAEQRRKEEERKSGKRGGTLRSRSAMPNRARARRGSIRKRRGR